MNFEFRFSLLVLPVLIFLWAFSRSKCLGYKKVFDVVALLIAIVYIFNLGGSIHSNLSSPPEWDFLSFWLDGQVAARGEDFYDADTYRKVELPYPPSEGFREQVLDIGFRYPPFTMFLFLPLGFMEYGQAYLFWQILNSVICCICVFMLWNLFFRIEGVSGLFFVLAIFFSLRASFSTFFFSQTNFIALMFFLFYWRFRERSWGGIFLVSALIVKPYMAIVFIYPILTRRPKQLLVLLGSLVVVVLIGGIVFGFDIIRSYIVGNPVENLPAYVYSESVNQSLLAVLLRSSLVDPTASSILFPPLYIGVSLLLALATFVIALKGYRRDDWLLIMVLFFALIVYPATLEHYGVFLIIPVLMLLQNSNRTLRDSFPLLLLVILIYFLSGYKSGQYTFFSNVVVWVISLVSTVGLDNFLASLGIRRANWMIV